MKTPNFWKDKNIISFILYPFAIVYKVIRRLHVLFSKEYKAKNLKIICVGNLTAGGSGKTPIALKIGEILKENDKNFAYLSKGYKGKIKKFTKVDSETHSYLEVGDEALLLAQLADTFICKNRKQAIKTLSKDYNYDIIVMDDGFQNPTIYKDKNIIVIDGEYGIGNGMLLPSGPLREKIHNSIKKIDSVIIIGQDKQNLEESFINNGIEVLRANIEEKDKSQNNKKYLAFCGIGRCEKFFNSLKKANYDIKKEISYEDHHKYTEEELKNIMTEAKKESCKIITTSKDWVKLPKKYREKINILEIEIKFYNNDTFTELILK
ncbi:MAG TPA: tetraacyldisaccharide 4'-kinase [Rickettsiales bacterium]|nr:tetraacyldisaccharide 4'-kinase [Rickettsiales bacterium]